jgi:outer membrane protein OmpA-like peptidoglycan-associated protein
MKKIALIFLTIIFTITLFSCAGVSRQQNGAAIGTGVGAGLGALLGKAIGRDTKSTLIGAGIGAIIGSITGNQIGSYMDRQERDMREALAASEAVSVRRVQEATAAAEASAVQRSRDVLITTFKSEVLFDFDSAVLKPGGYIELNRVAAVLNKYPDTKITVEGHTDAIGSEEYNLQLSQTRALAVKEALVLRGIDPNRIQAVGFGESQVLSSDNNMNRRVDIVIQPVIQAQG